jgi:hypothetical protein
MVQELRREVCLPLLLIALLVAVAILSLGREITAQTVPKLEVHVTGTSLVAGKNNTIEIQIVNNYERLFDFHVMITVPPPVTILGDSHWRFDAFPQGTSKNLTTTIFPPVSMIGGTITGSIALTYKRLGYTSYNTETHTVGFVIHGWIRMILYGLETIPSGVTRGSVVTISGNLLNEGNVAATHTNVTLLTRYPLIPTLESTIYVGQVDPGSPAPFSVAARVDPNASLGEYSVDLKVTFMDDRYIAHSFTANTTITVIEVPPPTRQPSTTENLLEFVERNLYYIVIPVVALIVSATVFKLTRRPPEEI